MARMGISELGHQQTYLQTKVDGTTTDDFRCQSWWRKNYSQSQIRYLAIRFVDIIRHAMCNKFDRAVFV